MLVQAHHQFRDNHTEMIAQQEAVEDDEYSAWIADIQSRRPLPEGACWLVCNEKSEHFVRAQGE